MKKELIFEKVQDILTEELDIDREEVWPESNLTSDIGLSSVEIMNLIASVEIAFSITVSERQLRSLASVQDIVDFVTASLEEKTDP